MNAIRFAPLALLLALPASASSTLPLTSLPGTAPTGLAAPADPGHFMFAVGGDNRSAGRGVPMPPTARRIFAELRLIRPPFVWWTGDTIYGSDDTVGEARAEYAGFLAAAAKADAPIFNAVGNHEIYNRADLEDLYRSTMGRLYGSFDYGNSHFIALDTEEIGRKPGIGPAQLAWLRRDLEANRGAANIFVFTHHPLFPKRPGGGFASAANRDEVHRLFVQYGVRAVFSGHEHLYYRSVHDGIDYIVTGGAGAANDLLENGGFQHYLLVYVNGRQIAVTVLAPWRLFASFGPVMPNGSCTALVTNYSANDFNVTLDFPTDALAGNVAARGSFTYKGVTRAVSAEVVPSRHPGTIAVQVTLPATAGVLVSIFPAKGGGWQGRVAPPKRKKKRASEDSI